MKDAIKQLMKAAQPSTFVSSNLVLPNLSGVKEDFLKTSTKEYVPYTGATNDVDLDEKSIRTKKVVIKNPSTSSDGEITFNSNGSTITINKPLIATRGSFGDLTDGPYFDLTGTPSMNMWKKDNTGTFRLLLQTRFADGVMTFPNDVLFTGMSSDFNGRKNRLRFNNFNGGFLFSSTFSGEHFIFSGSGLFGIGTSAPTAKLHVVGTNGFNQLRLQTSYTPTGTGDTNGNVGDVAWDNNYIYIKTSEGWKRAALSTW